MPTADFDRYLMKVRPALEVEPSHRTCTNCGRELGGGWADASQETPTRAVCADCARQTASNDRISGKLQAAITHKDGPAGDQTNRAERIAR